jgi:Phage-related baseplate assembly protein.
MQVKSEQGIKLYGFFRGTVVRHEDNLRCKIFIPSIYPDGFKDHPEKLPSAEQASPVFCGANKGNGMFSYPNIGATVWCFFENGDQTRPVYFASTLGGENPDDRSKEARPDVSQNDNPKKDTTRTGTDAQVHIISAGKNRITVYEGGTVSIKSFEGDTNDESIEKSKSEVRINSDGSISFVSTDRITFESPIISFNGGELFEVKTRVVNVVSDDKIGVATQECRVKADNTFHVDSPAINMDAKRGMFIAFGSHFDPVTVM